MRQVSLLIWFLALLVWPGVLAAQPRAFDVSGSPAVEPLTGETLAAPPPVTRPSSAPPAGEPTRMRFSIAAHSDRNELTLYVQRGVAKLGEGRVLGEGYYQPLCHGPCELRLPSGTHVFAVTSEGGSTIKLDRALRLERGQELVVSYRTRRAHRFVGWAVLGALVGTGIGLYALAQPDREGGKLKPGYVIGGSISIVSGLLSGLWLANLPDKATGWVR